MAELLSEHKLQIQKILVNNQKCKRLFLHGPPGASKSFTINSLLKDNNYKPCVLDAAQVTHNKEELIQFIDKVLSTKAEFGGKPCLVVDNIRGDYVKSPDRDTKIVIEALTYCLAGGKMFGHRERLALLTHNLLVVISDSNSSRT